MPTPSTLVPTKSTVNRLRHKRERQSVQREIQSGLIEFIRMVEESISHRGEYQIISLFK